MSDLNQFGSAHLPNQPASMAPSPEGQSSLFKNGFKAMNKKLLLALFLLLVVFPLLLLAIQVIKPRQVIQQILPTPTPTPTPLSTPTSTPIQPNSKESYLKAIDDLEQNIRSADLLQPDIEFPAINLDISLK